MKLNNFLQIILGIWVLVSFGWVTIGVVLFLLAHSLYSWAVGWVILISLPLGLSFADYTVLLSKHK